MDREKAERIAQVYLKVLKRLPDEGALATYSAVLDRGARDVRIERILKSSAEYKAMCSYDSSNFDIFIEKAEKLLRDITITPAAVNTKCAVIVEGRCVPCFGTIVKLTMHFLGPEWALHVVCTRDNVQYCRNATQTLPNVSFQLVDAMKDVRDYNNLLLSLRFWEEMLSGIDTVLIFQTDSFICKRGIESFLDVDYIGARSPCDKVMNGGLSLRRRAKMIELLKLNQPKLFENEDVFFSRLVQHSSQAKQDSFSLEQREHNGAAVSLGVHKLWFYCPDSASWVFERTLENLST